MSEFENKINNLILNINHLKTEVSKVIVGQEDVISQVICALLSGGHVLLEGVPGIGKTLIVTTISKCLDLKFSRIQFTPDLMPADITGTNVIINSEQGDRVYEYQKGPIFTNILLADEINRATPKTQSALLEAMQEGAISVAGKQMKLDKPFMVIATQNPIEMEGTYPLPEAQLDRFMFKIIVNPPSFEELVNIADRTTINELVEVDKVCESSDIIKYSKIAYDVPVAAHILEFAAKIVEATNPNSDFATELVKKYVKYGSSPRGLQSIILPSKIYALMNNRFNVSTNDIKLLAIPALRHRIILNFEGEAGDINKDSIIEDIIDSSPLINSKINKLVN